MSYTEEMTREIVDEYNGNPTRETVDAIAARIGKTSRSVIAKLAAAGVYQTPKRTTKTGEPIVKKEQLVQEIGTWLGIEVPTLAKTGKQDLKLLHTKIARLCDVELEEDNG